MPSPDDHEATVHSRGIATLLLCGAIIVLMLAVLAFGNASEWFDYVSGVVFVGLSASLAYRGFATFRAARDTSASL